MTERPAEIEEQRLSPPFGDGRGRMLGLGLAVARQLARLMGGDVVYKRRNDWTSFELTLPVLTDSSPAVAVGSQTKS